MDDYTHQRPISENAVFRFLVSPDRRIFRHLLLIGFIGIVLYNSASVIESPTTIFVYFVTIFYLNMYVLAPKLLFRNKNIEYCLSVIGILIIAATGGYFFNPFNGEHGLNIPFFPSLPYCC